MTRFLTTVVATAAAVLACSAAQAGYTTPLTAFMTGKGESDAPRDADLAALIAQETAFKNLLASGLLSEGFESMGDGSVITNPLTLNGVKVSFAGDGSVRTANSAAACDVGDPLNCTPGSTRNGRYSVLPEQTTNFYEAAIVRSGTNFSLSFDQAVAGFSFFGMDLGDFGGVIDLELLNQAGGVAQTIHLNDFISTSATGNQGGALFLGVTSDVSTSDFWGVRFVGTLPAAPDTCGPLSTADACTGDVFAFDRFTVATRSQLASSSGTTSSGTSSTGSTGSSGGGGGTVPEPLSLLLALGALGGAAVARRRRA